MSLAEIARRYATDKETIHGYAAAYERHLGHLRSEPMTLLELGIGGYQDPYQGGESLRMWHDYFVRGEIVGLDIEHKWQPNLPHVHLEQGAQDDPEVIARLARAYGPFDVIVDDASHIMELSIASFDGLWPHVKPGGYYIVEDLNTCYRTEWGGCEAGVTRSTTLGHLVHASQTDEDVESATFYREIAFVRRKVEGEGI